ncbi:hypothetical protein EVG20_g1628 [Dentipellis fragilis]|uniref:Uncharacterized protein n=1 Tax=Dentipellis fragilis TaxID=205917 RepID=A0A4Y9ZAA0_9AGAM|nr:hypothetical protein EVG20_g1628 [Dentipellis fragilis]
MSSAPSESGDSSLAAWMAFYDSRVSSLNGISPRTSSSSVVEISRAKLDQELQNLRTITSFLGTRRNAFASINRLHPEILAHVFAYLAIAEPPSGLYRARRKRGPYNAESHEVRRQQRSLGWMAVTYVCRSWREVALAHPSLWGIDICSIPSWTAERLRRSKQAQIEIIWPRITRGNMETDDIFLALTQLHRTRKLELGSSTSIRGNVAKELFSCLSAGAPVLESFFCALQSGQPLAQGLALPSTFLVGNDSKLRSVDLMNVPLPLDLFFPSSVVELRLRAASDVIPGCTRGHILALLDRLPRLQTLELHNTIRYLPSKSTESNLLVSLPLLQSLRVTAGASACIWLVQHLSLRSLTDLRVYVLQENFSPKAICTALRPAFVAFSRAHHLDPLQSLCIRNSPQRSDIEGWSTLDCPDIERRYVSPGEETSVFQFILTESFDMDADTRTVILEETFDGLDIRGVKKLRLWSDGGYEETWLGRPTILESLSAVEDVCICDTGMGSTLPLVRGPMPFVDYLARSVLVSRSPYNPPTGTVFFPSLRRIQLVGVCNEESFHALLFALERRRHQTGVQAIKEVEFEMCRLGLPLIKQFGEVVEKVIHDLHPEAEVEWD